MHTDLPYSSKKHQNIIMLTLDVGGHRAESNKKLYPFNHIILTLDVGGQGGEPYRDSAKAAGQRLTAQIFSPRSSRWGGWSKTYSLFTQFLGKHNIFNIKDIILILSFFLVFLLCR